jgi:hypothetical protein
VARGVDRNASRSLPVPAPRGLATAATFPPATHQRGSWAPRGRTGRSSARSVPPAMSRLPTNPSVPARGTGPVRLVVVRRGASTVAAARRAWASHRGAGPSGVGKSPWGWPVGRGQITVGLARRAWANHRGFGPLACGDGLFTALCIRVQRRGGPPLPALPASGAMRHPSGPARRLTQGGWRLNGSHSLPSACGSPTDLVSSR